MKTFICLIFSCFINSSIADVLVYQSSFKGIKVGQSTLNEIIKQHGIPFETSTNSNNQKYSFNKFEVTINNNDDKVNTIIIFDPTYSDLNGLSVGTHSSVVESKLMAYGTANYIVDKKMGLFIGLKVITSQK